MLLNPGGIDDPSRVVDIRVHYFKLNIKVISMSLTDFDDIRKARNLFSAVSLATFNEISYMAGGSPERLVGARVSHEWFDVFGVNPLHGR